MTPNNNLSVLPWYDSISRQNHRRDYAYGNVYQLITPDRKLLPFQFRRETRTNPISQVLLKGIDGKLISDITQQMDETGLTIKRFVEDGYDLIIYPGLLPMATPTPEGLYYAELTDGVETWYSEVFNIVRTVDDYLSIEWWDEHPLYYSGGHIEYSGQKFKNRVFFPTQVGKPDYDFTEEGEKRDGYFFPEKQTSEKIYKFSFLAPEYLCDAMRIIRMSDHIKITSRGETYTVDSFLMTPKWQEQGDLAVVEAEFETDTVIKKIGRGITTTNKGDFNNDFNNDYKK
jgi:hypothetical protein